MTQGLDRGHDVTAFVRVPRRLDVGHSRFEHRGR
ncbi:MAG: hypothetical protein ACRDPK_06755 [Carbonactinosporaceae bacterium]